MNSLRMRAFGAQTLLIEWPKVISPEIHAELLAYRKLVKLFSDKIQETVITYQALALHLKPGYSPLALKEELENTISLNEVEPIKPSMMWELPVCYHPDLAVDFNDILEQNKLTAEELIQKHTEVDYHIYFCGFLPGFIYLGGLNEALHSPRLDKPRLRVPAGSVGIAGSQTGIYPSDSPGGWKLIGRCPVTIFDPLNDDRPSPFRAGQLLRFVPVSMDEYEDIKETVRKGEYEIKKIDL